MTARPIIDNDWAAAAIESLADGETVWISPRGHSMAPHVLDGQLCEVEPANTRSVSVDDIVLCAVNGKVLFHLVKATRLAKANGYVYGEVEICNANGHVNGWTQTVYGRLVKVSP